MKDFVVAARRPAARRAAVDVRLGVGTRPTTAGRWRMGALSAGRGLRRRCASSDAAATLHSPPDQVLRAASLETLYIGLREPDSLAADASVHARLDPASPWQRNRSGDARRDTALARRRDLRCRSRGLRTGARARAIAESLKIVLQFPRR